MVDDGRTTDGRRTDGRTPEHGYTISSPCEPDGSGELKMDPRGSSAFKMLFEGENQQEIGKWTEY